jgi:hypothetical protein
MLFCWGHGADLLAVRIEHLPFDADALLATRGIDQTDDAFDRVSVLRLDLVSLTPLA